MAPTNDTNKYEIAVCLKTPLTRRLTFPVIPLETHEALNSDKQNEEAVKGALNGISRQEVIMTAQSSAGVDGTRRSCHILHNNTRLLEKLLPAERILFF